MEIQNLEFFRLVEDEALINRLGFNNIGAEKIISKIIANKKMEYFESH